MTKETKKEISELLEMQNTGNINEIFNLCLKRSNHLNELIVKINGNNAKSSASESLYSTILHGTCVDYFVKLKT